MTNDAVLRCDNFELDLDGVTIRSDSFDLGKGSINLVYGDSRSNVGNFLLLMAGLHNSRGLTKPAPPGELVRQDARLTREQLSFLELNGRVLYGLPAIERARQVGMIFENPELFTVGRTVLEDFQFSFSAVGEALPMPQMLRPYGLMDKLDRRTEVLSGGEQHRLNCASVMELSRDLLVADFATSNLDPAFIDCLMEWFEDRAKDGAAVLLHGLPINKESNQRGLILTGVDGKFRVGDPPATEFPPLAEENRVLRAAYSARSTGSEVVLTAERLGRADGITRPIDLQITAGSIVQIVGENGCGKTTLAKIVVGYRIARIGRLELGGGVVAGLAPQFPERVFLKQRVRDEVSSVDALKLAGIDEELWDENPLALPRADQKLLACLIALEHSRGLVFLDEPTSGMDFNAKKAFIRVLNAYPDLAIVIFNHDRALAGIGVEVKWEDIVR